MKQTTQTKREKMLAEIEKHGENLNRIFNTGMDNYLLCSKMRRFEIEAHRLAEHYCNGTGGVTTDNWGEKTERILKQVRKVLNCTDNYPIFVNGDARGYALKIDDEYVRKTNMVIYKDWGGYGIIAPDFSPNN